MSGERPGRSEQRLPKLWLDELLDELQARNAAARGTQDRVHSLLEAVLSAGRELDLPQVLRRIVEAAVVLVDAEYGVLGVSRHAPAAGVRRAGGAGPGFGPAAPGRRADRAAPRP